MLRERADLRSLAFIGITLVLLALPLARPLDAPLWAQAAWILLAGIFCLSCNVINHNHMHLAIFEGRRANLVLNCFIALSKGHTATTVVVPHNFNHHVFANTETDWIKVANAGTGWGLARVVRFVLVGVRTMARERRKSGAPALPPEQKREQRIEQTALFVAIAAALWISPARFAAFVALPWLIGAFLLVSVNLLQHDGCAPGNAPESARNFTGAFTNWFFFNNGYHAIHHLRPRLHWSRLPAEHRQLISGKIPPDLERRSIVGFLITHYAFGTGATKQV